MRTWLEAKPEAVLQQEGRALLELGDWGWVLFAVMGGSGNAGRKVFPLKTCG